MIRLLVVDNYDSFTYNLVQYLGELGAEVTVKRNDELPAPAAFAALRFDGVVISPGPGRPEDAGLTLPLLTRLAGRVPVLGVCLGHQALAQAYGGEVVRAERVMHGKTSLVHHRAEGLFAGLPSPFAAARYHSLVVKPETLPEELEVTAWTADGEIMGLRHRRHALYGVQFHPESVLTEGGKALLANFLDELRQSPLLVPVSA